MPLLSTDAFSQTKKLVDEFQTNTGKGTSEKLTNLVKIVINMFFRFKPVTHRAGQVEQTNQLHHCSLV